MSFGITVHRQADEPMQRAHPDFASEGGDFDDWIQECQTRWVYENPLGADGTVFEFWHVPAKHLGLHMTGSIYHEGLRVKGEQLVSRQPSIDG